MRRFIQRLGLLSVTLGPSLPSQNAAPADWAAQVEATRALIAEFRVVGGATAYVRRGSVIAHTDFGDAERGRKPVTPATIFHWGSITKTLTAIAVMQLRDRGLLSLDDRATRWIPELRQIHSPYGSMDEVTIRMLLSHSSGLQNPTWPYSRGRSWEPFEPTRWEQLVAMMPYQSLVFEPMSRYGYSNPAFIYLARIVEAITGDPYQAYIYKNLWTPWGLTTSYFGGTPYHLVTDRSHNYEVVAGGDGALSVRDNGREFDPGITIPNGGWNAPLSDLASYIGFLTGGPAAASSAGRVLARQSLEEMWQPVRVAALKDDWTESIGLGFFLHRELGTRIVGHTGSQAGFVSFMYFDPATGDGIVTALNTIDNRNDSAFGRRFEALGQRARRLLAAASR